MKKLIAMTLAVLLLLTCFAGCTKANEKETIVVGYTIYAPMNYLDEAGNLIGFDTDLAKAVFENLGYEVLFKEIDWNSKYTDLASGTIDCVWNGFTCNTADDDGVLRSEKVDFSYNYMENRQVIVAKKDAGITSAADLSGKQGAVESGSAGETYAKGFEGVTVKGFTKQTDCLFEVNAGTCEFAVLDAQLAKSYAGKGDYSNLTIVDGLSSDVEYYAIGFKKGSELTAKVNAELEKLAADGTITKLAKQYGVENTAITDFSDQK
ncbi:MAG: transporter substrate-binding domain-containing protein [Oscillospiraceae bacterium]|nr:transporter substrate-binding domain-containing protein [Oscillospiraceae bacterium]